MCTKTVGQIWPLSRVADPKAHSYCRGALLVKQGWSAMCNLGCAWSRPPKFAMVYLDLFSFDYLRALIRLPSTTFFNTYYE